MSEQHVPRATNSEMEKIRDLVAEIEVAMLTTAAPNGAFRTRPMGTVLDREEPVIWLFISSKSDTAAEVNAKADVGLSFADPERNRYVSIAGTARLLDDRAEIRKRWRDEFGKWFPGGPDDPVLVLLKVTITQAEYWDDSAKLMRNFFDTMAAPFSGVPPEAAGEHARVRPQ